MGCGKRRKGGGVPHAPVHVIPAQARIEYVMVDNPQPKFSRLPFAPVIADSALVMRGRRASTATSVMLDRLHEASEVCSRCHSFITSYRST